MREIHECKAEVFRRSEKRIKEQKRKRLRIIALSVSLCLCLALMSIVLFPVEDGNTTGAESSAGTEPTDGMPLGGANDYTDLGSLDSFSFSLTWGCYGISSYDSASGKLVKTKDATTPEDYVTTYVLTETQKKKIYNLVWSLNIASYPDDYNPHSDGLQSSPSMTLILSVKTDTTEKTIKAESIPLTYSSEDAKGQKFLTVCKKISDILTETEEWKALPEYEFFYD